MAFLAIWYLLFDNEELPRDVGRTLFAIVFMLLFWPLFVFEAPDPYEDL